MNFERVTRAANVIYLASYRYRMAKIQCTVEIDAPQEKVWKIISDFDRETTFWKGTKKIQDISRDGNVIKREVTIAFRDQKCMQEVTIKPDTEIHALFTDGVIDGTKIMTLSFKDGTTTFDVAWDIRLTGMMSIFTCMIKKHIKSGTQQAMNSIKQEAQR